MQGKKGLRGEYFAPRASRHNNSFRTFALLFERKSVTLRRQFKKLR